MTASAARLSSPLFSSPLLSSPLFSSISLSSFLSLSLHLLLPPRLDPLWTCCHPAGELQRLLSSDETRRHAFRSRSRVCLCGVAAVCVSSGPSVRLSSTSLPRRSPSPCVNSKCFPSSLRFCPSRPVAAGLRSALALLADLRWLWLFPRFCVGCVWWSCVGRCRPPPLRARVGGIIAS